MTTTESKIASRHTPEPWHCNGVQIIGKAGKRTQNIAECFNVGFDATTANARRIVECVNACHDLEHPADQIYAWSHACAGMADPVAEITALREALEETASRLGKLEGLYFAAIGSNETTDTNGTLQRARRVLAGKAVQS